MSEKSGAPEPPEGPVPPGMVPPGMTPEGIPPGVLHPGIPPGPAGAGAAGPPQGAAGETVGGTVSPQDALTRYDAEKDAYHCSYGIPAPALTVWDPERKLVVRVDRDTHKVVGFSIPDFTAWHRENAAEDGTFEVDLPDVWPMELTDTSAEDGADR